MPASVSILCACITRGAGSFIDRVRRNHFLRLDRFSFCSWGASELSGVLDADRHDCRIMSIHVGFGGETKEWEVIMTQPAVRTIRVTRPGDVATVNLLAVLKQLGAGQKLAGGADCWYFPGVGHWVDGIYRSWKKREIDGDEVIEVLFEECSGYGLVPFGEEHSERDNDDIPVGLTHAENVSVKITLTAYSRNFLDDMVEGERYFYCITGVGEAKGRKQAPWIVECYPIAANAPRITFGDGVPPEGVKVDPSTGEVTGENRPALPPQNATTAGVRGVQTPRRDEMPGEHVEDKRRGGRTGARSRTATVPTNRNPEPNPEGYASNF